MRKSDSTDSPVSTSLPKSISCQTCPLRLAEPGTPPMATDTVAEAVLGNTSHATSAVLVTISPIANEASSNTRKRSSAVVAAGIVPTVAVNTGSTKLIPAGRPFNRPLPATYDFCPATGRFIASVMTTLVASILPILVTTTTYSSSLPASAAPPPTTVTCLVIDSS